MGALPVTKNAISPSAVAKRADYEGTTKFFTNLKTSLSVFALKNPRYDSNTSLLSYPAQAREYLWLGLL